MDQGLQFRKCGDAGGSAARSGTDDRRLPWCGKMQSRARRELARSGADDDW